MTNGVIDRPNAQNCGLATSNAQACEGLGIYRGGSNGYGHGRCPHVQRGLFVSGTRCPERSERGVCCSGATRRCRVACIKKLMQEERRVHQHGEDRWRLRRWGYSFTRIRSYLIIIFTCGVKWHDGGPCGQLPDRAAPIIHGGATCCRTACCRAGHLPAHVVDCSAAW